MGTTGTREVLVAAGLEDPDLLDTIWEVVVAAAVRWWQEQEGGSAAEMAQRCTRLLSVVAGR